jgi:hypothetical protein
MTIGEALKSLTVSQFFLLGSAVIGFVSAILTIFLPQQSSLIAQVAGACTTFWGALGTLFTTQAQQVQRASQIPGVQVKVDAVQAPSNIVNLAASKDPSADNVTLK